MSTGFFLGFWAALISTVGGSCFWAGDLQETNVEERYVVSKSALGDVELPSELKQGWFMQKVFDYLTDIVNSKHCISFPNI